MVKRIQDLIANKPETFVYASILFFLIAGLLYSFHLGDKFLFPDEVEYYTLAKNLAEGHGYTLDGITPSAWRTPGYPLFLSLFIKLAGASPIFLRYLNYIGLALCVFFIHAILRRENAGSGSGLSALLLVLYGVLFYTAGTLYPQTICSLVIVILIWLVTGPGFSYARAVIFGFLSATMIMILPATIFIPPLVVLWMFFPNKYEVFSEGHGQRLGGRGMHFGMDVQELQGIRGIHSPFDGGRDQSLPWQQPEYRCHGVVEIRQRRVTASNRNTHRYGAEPLLHQGSHPILEGKTRIGNEVVSFENS